MIAAFAQEFKKKLNQGLTRTAGTTLAGVTGIAAQAQSQSPTFGPIATTSGTTGGGGGGGYSGGGGTGGGGGGSY